MVRTWMRILAGLLVLDVRVFALADPIVILFEGDHSEAGWDVLGVRLACGVIAGVLLIALLVAWNLKYNLPKK
jgi:hypothetical protein